MRTKTFNRVVALFFIILCVLAFFWFIFLYYDIYPYSGTKYEITTFDGEKIICDHISFSYGQINAYGCSDCYDHHDISKYKKVGN